MKRSFLLLNWLLFFIAFPTSAQVGHILLTPKPEIPRVETGDVVIFHTGYSFLYDEEHEQASWVAYELTREETNNRVKRSNRFKPDPWVSTGTANNADYARSGYDRGHLAPAADMGWSATVMAESFYYSNMSPQLHGFNAGIWKKLEELVRTWAIEQEGLLVVTGPVLKKGLKTIGANGVSVPEWYYKVILDHREPGIKAIAFLLPHASFSGSLQSFVVPIDSVESVTGIDFFPDFPGEDYLEKNSCIELWNWTGKRTTPTNGYSHVHEEQGRR